MSTKSAPRPNSAKVVPMEPNAGTVSQLLQQYGTGSTPLAGTDNAFYQRHLIFDRAIDPKVASARERFEAVAPIPCAISWPSAGWRRRPRTSEMNAKRIYYLSMEFLHRALTGK